MSIGIGENLGKSFGFAKDSLVGKWLNWLLLIIVTIIPIVNFIGNGIYLRIYRGEEPVVKDIVKAFIDGILLTVIGIIYMIIPWIVDALVSNLGVVGDIIALIVTFIFLLLLLPAEYAFAQKGFGAAFAFGDHIAKIKKLGWGQYILAVLVFIIVVAVLGSLAVLIPVIGWIFLPFVCIFSMKFVANLFA